MILTETGGDETEIFNHILINGRLLIEPDEMESYDYKYRSKFDSDEEFMEWVEKNLTVEFTSLEALNEHKVFNDKGSLVDVMWLHEREGLPKYSYGEHMYWGGGEWNHRERPRNLIQIRDHYRDLFPTAEVKAMKREIVTRFDRTTTMVEIDAT